MTKKKDDDMDGIIFFGAADRKSDRDGELDPEGKITSEYPAFYFKSKIDELKDEIKTDEAHLARNKRFRIFDSVQVATQEEALKDKRERLELIESSKPKMTSKQ